MEKRCKQRGFGACRVAACGRIISHNGKKPVMDTMDGTLGLNKVASFARDWDS